MILKELNLISFGKFENKRIEFQDGLNIIYGENESGKTTVHNFIDGMFFGFLKPYARRRDYLGEYRKYKPWNGEQYSGILKLIYNKKPYRIERDFAQGEAKVYEDLTGEDITAQIDKGEKIKVHLPGIYFFDFNNTVYKNTISIKQLENRIDSSLSKEVKDRLANVSTSLDDDISVKNALADLDKKLKDIGTEKAYTSTYGQAKRRLNSLYESRKLALDKQEEYNNYIENSHLLKIRVEKDKQNLKVLNDKLQKANILEKKRLYEESLHINNEIQTIDEKIIKSEKYSTLSFDDYTDALGLENNKEYTSKEILNLTERLEKIEQKLKNINMKSNSGIIDGIDAEELYKDISIYSEQEEEKNGLILNNEKSKLDFLNSELKGKVDKANGNNTLMFIFLFLTIASLGLIALNPLFMIIAIPLSVGVFYFKSRNKKVKKDMDNLKQSIKEKEIQEIERNNDVIKIEGSQKEILMKYNCSTRIELSRLYDKIRVYHMTQTNNTNEINNLTQERVTIIKKIETKKRMKSEIINEVNILIQNNNSKTLEDFKEGLQKKRAYDNLVNEKDKKSQILGKVLGDYSLDSLKDELSNYDEKHLKDDEDIDKVKIINEIKHLEEILSTLNQDDVRLEEKINSLIKEVGSLVEIEEDIARLEKLIEDFDNKVKAINLAKDTIESISKDIHSQFAPTINKDISKLIKIVTDGKYDQVKIDDGLNITVENPITKEIVDIDSLSGGTIDQLYFSLRFSILNSMNRDSLPLILDDCFIQYDIDRLENMLRFLNSISHEKQILLFTCHHREKEILDELGLKYNLIYLS